MAAKVAKKRNGKWLRLLLSPIVFVLKIVGRILWIVLWPFRPMLRPPLKYLRGVRQEFRKVSWPTRKVTWRLTFSVVIFSVIFALFVALVDYSFNVLFEKVIVKG